MMDIQAWIYETKGEALDGATDWLKANDLADVVSPNKLVQTLIPNVIHSGCCDKCYVVLSVGLETMEGLREQQAIQRKVVTDKLEALENKRQALVRENRWVLEVNTDDE